MSNNGCSINVNINIIYIENKLLNMQVEWLIVIVKQVVADWSVWSYKAQ